MSLRVTEEVMRRSLHFCSRRFPCYLGRLPATTSITDASVSSQQLARIWRTGQSQTCLPTSLIGSARFYSHDSRHSEDFEEKEPAEIQVAATMQGQRPSSFIDRLALCSSPSDVLDLTCQYAPTARQNSSCLTQMWATTKMMSDEQARYELRLMFEHPAFEKLLQQSMKSVRFMTGEDMAYSVLYMVKLGVPQRSRVVQTFLRASQEKLNDLDEKGLSVLATCLDQIEEGTPNVAALKKAMGLLVESRLPEIKNVVLLQTMMRVVGKDAPLNLKRKLEGKALSMTDQFSLPNTLYMISTMATMGFYSKPLLDVCSNKIKEKLNEIPFSRQYKLLLSCKQLLYRDLDLLTDMSDYAASMIDIWSNKQLVIFLSAFESLHFCPTSFMGAFAEKVIANPEPLTLRDLLCVLKVYSSLNFDLQHQRQQFLDGLTGALVSYLPRMSGFELLKTVYHLCLLCHFPPAPLEQLLQSSTLEQLKTTVPKYRRNCERMFRMVDASLRLDRPQLPQHLTVPPFVLGSPTPSSSADKLWLLQSLRSLVGDQADTVLQEMVVLENSYLIDGVITKPLTRQPSVSEASEAECRSPAESSQRIAVICTPSPFCYGTSHLRGPLAAMTRHLNSLGYDCVSVTEHKLHAMSEEKRMEFLSRQLFPERHGSDAQPETVQLGA
ncbi:FAST kinase domain-containing protein 2, mitochondrial [Acanthopagrus latus]|uniref:FAST kinase domain-containing protein 2, mitochondrial n=1 Tax=Acanthopagrus latus TaxID=8177 RepID=UPI00187C03EE|nr:FAST kinase domain-containing protein 2, mitochondrial [Acanthopagrus latus]